ncbi:MAG TPA: NTP transferase domain-containing protein [Thiolinea sp.]|nr:NTP transferase domain-containing protein [Thiolinea sp.]
MKFGHFPLTSALGVYLAHQVRLPGRTLRKGCVLDADAIAALAQAGVESVSGARLEAGELDEDQAAAQAATWLAGAQVSPQAPARGRCNLQAQSAGILLLERERINTLNRIDEALTIGTLPAFAPVRAGQVVATIKTIPFAVAAETLATWQATASPLQVAPFQTLHIALIMSTLPGLPAALFANTAAVTRRRLQALGNTLALEQCCPHDEASVGQALQHVLAQGAELVLIAGATVSKDRGDTIPAGIVAAGGEILHFGMPVEPANMLLYARHGKVPVLNLPGCARSHRINGLDWLLQRLLAGLLVSAQDIMDMGAGGLLPGAGPDPGVPVPRIAALILAAGRSRRMGAQNKLCCELDGVPMVRRVADAALASGCTQTLVVTGHETEKVEATLQDCPVSLVYNPGFAEGMASSLRCGLRALPPDLDGVLILLGDMPGITATHINALLAQFDPAAPAIIVPEHEGRRGHPVLWPRHYRPELLALEGDQGARHLLEQHADQVLRIPADAAMLMDVDTPEALAAFTGVNA